jgi:hypothetical protein
MLDFTATKIDEFFKFHTDGKNYTSRGLKLWDGFVYRHGRDGACPVSTTVRKQEAMHKTMPCTIKNDFIATESGQITSLNFSYNTHNKKGIQENFITIIDNSDSFIHVLQINAYVY